MADELLPEMRSSSHGEGVMIGHTSDGITYVGSQRDAGAQPHRFTPEEWRAFLAGVIDHEFDLPPDDDAADQ